MKQPLRVHTMLIIGGTDMEAGNISVHLDHVGLQGAKPKAEVMADIPAKNRERKLETQQCNQLLA